MTLGILYVEDSAWLTEMHEVSVMSSIVDSVLEELKKYDVEKIEEVFLTIGELTFLGEEQLRFAFEVLTRDTLLEGSKLTIEKEQISVQCTACDYKGSVEYIEDDTMHYALPNLTCPKCGEKVEIASGKSCMVRSVRVVER